jgi:hypothetical protein
LRKQPPAWRRFWPDAVLLLLAALIAGVGPRLVEGDAALQWTYYHASRGVAGEQPAASARGAARHAAIALDRLAPLPAGAEAARMALALGRELQATNRAAALELYTEVGAALEAMRDVPVRGLGLAGLSAEARTLAARARELEAEDAEP